MTTATDVSVRTPDDARLPDDDVRVFLDFLHELKAAGCSLLVVGDTSRRVFARASEHLFGSTETIRYRLLAVTDAPSWSVGARLPDSGEMLRSLAETTHVVNHAAVPRSVTSATNPGTPVELAGIPETRVVDPGLEGLQRAIVEGIDEFEDREERLKPADVRVGIDSLAPLLDHYEEEVVRQCLDAVGSRLREVHGMGHFVLPRPYDDETVERFARDVDAVIELRAADLGGDDHCAEERWHVPRFDITTDWTPL